ncbi:MAG: ATP phosphoribosyltransferase [Lachnospiraceae bacterium]|jgi:ATP phosphoribosyltransferase
MNLDYSVLRNDEKIILALRSLYENHGYSHYKMSRFEEFDLYVRNKNYLVSDRIISFTDTNGRLMAMKPDVTLSIIKSCDDESSSVHKLYYNENVYRANNDEEGFKEIMQAGLECIGNLTASDISEVVSLAARSLAILSDEAVLEISHLGILSCVVDSLNVSEEGRSGIYRCVNEKNASSLDEVCKKENIPGKTAAVLKELALLYDRPKAAMAKLTNALKKIDLLSSNPALCNSLDALGKLLQDLEEDDIYDLLRIDLSISSDLKYYNDIVFSGYVNGVPAGVLSGGQYDGLMKKMGRNSLAIGFAVYLDKLERIDEIDSTAGRCRADNFINIALPKGRLGDKAYEMFAAAGLECPSILESGRKLIFENSEQKVRYFWAKPSDVAIYVERGIADIGVAGKDILLEYEPDLYELLDLNIGKCRMCVAASEDYADIPGRTLRVATKFSNIARAYYSSIDRNIDIIHLNGSVEIAPILGLSDVIVDIVETGTTLRENNLKVVETIFPISARLIANKSRYKFNSEMIDRIRRALAAQVPMTD